MKKILHVTGIAVFALCVILAQCQWDMACAGQNALLARGRCKVYFTAVEDWMRETGYPAPPYLKVAVGAVSEDPWGMRYWIELRGGGRFRVCSNGPDNAPWSDDDICWDPRP